MVCIDPSIDEVREYLEDYFTNARQILKADPDMVIELCVLCVQCLEVLQYIHYIYTIAVASSDGRIFRQYFP